jgi:hypothetical protein
MVTSTLVLSKLGVQLYLSVDKPTLLLKSAYVTSKCVLPRCGSLMQTSSEHSTVQEELKRMNTESPTTRKVALVVGANGVIGRNLIDYLITLPDWEVIGISRRGGESNDRVRYIAAVLLHIDDIREKLHSLTEVTHIFYAAYQDRPTWAELVPPNLAMLVNIFDDFRRRKVIP